MTEHECKKLEHESGITRLKKTLQAQRPDSQWTTVTTYGDKTLRDEFAMQFMEWVAQDSHDKQLGDVVESMGKAVVLGYKYADLAMKAREPKKETDNGRSNEDDASV